MNTLYYGDNLDILRNYIPNETVDLIYLDPPFNSNRDYNVLFKDESNGVESQSQITAFEDTWHWDIKTEAIYKELITGDHIPSNVSSMIGALREFIGANQMMAYLVNMTIRLVELHRVLKSTGSLYLHCDPTASHYLKIVLDSIFGIKNFVNEIIWKRSDAKGDASGQGAKHFGRVNDVILFYSKSPGENIFHAQFNEFEQDYIDKWYTHKDPDGRKYKLDNMLGPGGAAKGNPQYEVMGVTRFWRYSKLSMEKLISEGRVIQTRPGAVPMYKRYLDETKGVPLTTNWADIRPLHGWSNEKIGYPTQKPQSLLERIILASSNPGDLILDPFCGCGSAIAAAQATGRQWIGIDITHLAIALIKYRMLDSFPGIEFQIIGEPESTDSARYLANADRHQFEWWALSMIRARPGQPDGDKGKKGADQGIDGIINFIDDPSGKPQKAIVQVKSGHVSSAYIRDLVGTINRVKAAIGILITLEEPTKPMIKEAAEAGFYHSILWDKDYPRIQIRTIDELIKGKTIDLPPSNVSFQKAEKQKQKDEGKQQGLF